jgi:predicted dehydrogenase
MNVFNIAIIGAGQLGVRHLQGVAGITLPAAVYVVDTNPQSLEKARACYNEVPANEKIVSVAYLTALNQLPGKLDLVIIATGSVPRMQLTRELVAAKEVKYILFEKFLFPSIASYPLVAALLKEHGIKAWVNCPRRLLRIYKELQRLLQGKSGITFNVTGGNWGLGCNSIHFIDIFSMLTGEQDIKVDVSALEPVVHASKRAGYVELSGTVIGQSARGNSIVLTADANATQAPVITIVADGIEAIIRESAREITINRNGASETMSFEFPYQSQLSGSIAETILSSGNSDLTAYPASANLHLSFLHPVVKWYNDITGEKGDQCPIT